VTACVVVAVLPDASLAVQVTLVIPSGNPPAGALLVTTGLASQMSLTVGVPRFTVVPPLAVCSEVTGAGAVIVGTVVSLS